MTQAGPLKLIRILRAGAWASCNRCPAAGFVAQNAPPADVVGWVGDPSPGEPTAPRAWSESPAALALQCASKTGTRDAIEGEIEHQEMVLRQDFGKRAEMTLG